MSQDSTSSAVHINKDTIRGWKEWVSQTAKQPTRRETGEGFLPVQ